MSTETNSQIGFYVDQTRCMGCAACVIACKQWHDIPAGPASWMRVQSIEEGVLRCFSECISGLSAIQVS